MLDIKFIRENPDAVRENIKKKFQDAKLPLVDEVLDLDSKRRAAIAEADQLRSNRNTLSKQIGMLMGQAKKDPSKLEDPSLIIYAPVRVLGKTTIVTNGDQTDTIYDHLAAGKGFAKALRTRTFEPDSPNFTPRISGIVKVKDGAMKYKLSILKSDGGNADSVERFFFEYDQPVAGEGRFIHTYRCDGSPIPSFAGEPEHVRLMGDIDTFTRMVWNSLNEDNKVSLFVRYIDLATGKTQDRIVNKYEKV